MSLLVPDRNFVFIDLSKLEASLAAAFLADFSRRPTGSAPSDSSRCHWILAPTKNGDLLSAQGPGPDYLRARLSGGDRLFWTSPTGWNWDHLFPSERDKERDFLDSLSSQETFVFFESADGIPSWIDEDRPGIYRATPAGLWIKTANGPTCLPWALKNRTKRGVWWIVPGQVLLASLPPAPWYDLTGSAAAWRVRPPRGPRVQPSPSPQEKLPLHKLALTRRSPTLSPLHQSILFQTQEYPGLGTKEAVDFDEALGGIRKRSLVANMQGQTDLAEGDWRVRFRGGTLESITDTQNGAVLCSGANSYLEWDGQRHSFVVNSAFSFEGDYSWGLRQSLVLEHEDLLESGRAILDFYFVEDSREFFIAVTVRWPRWHRPVTLNRWSALEMTLFELSQSKPLTTRCQWPDGRSTDGLFRTATSGVLPGTDFVFTGLHSLVLGFPQNQTPRPHFLPWHWDHHRGRSRLVVNPEGGTGPRPSNEFDGVEEHFTFYLAPAEGAKLPFNVTRKQAIELIPPYVVDTK